MEDEEEVRVVAACADPGAAADPGEHEEHDRRREDRKAEQAVARLAAPHEVRPDHEPDEQVERSRPRRPRKPVGPRRLDAEQRGLNEPAHAHAPGREPPGPAGVTYLAEVRDGCLAVGEERRPKEQLSH